MTAMKLNIESSQHIVPLGFVIWNRNMQHSTPFPQMLHGRLWTHLYVDPIELAFCVVSVEMVPLHIITVKT